MNSTTQGYYRRGVDRRLDSLTINPIDAHRPAKLDKEQLSTILSELFADLAADAYAEKEITVITDRLEALHELSENAHFTDAYDSYEVDQARSMLRYRTKRKFAVYLDLASYAYGMVRLDEDDEDNEVIKFNYFEQYSWRSKSLDQAIRSHKAGNWPDFKPWPIPDARDFVWIGTTDSLTKFAGLDKHPYAPLVAEESNAFRRDDWPSFVEKYSSRVYKSARPYLWDTLLTTIEEIWDGQWGISASRLYEWEHERVIDLSTQKLVDEIAVNRSKILAKEKAHEEKSQES